MKFTKHLFTAAVLAAMGTAAHADILTVVNGGATFTGSGALTFSADLLGALDTGKIAATGYGAATPSILKDTDGFYTSIQVSAPMATLSLDTDTLEVVGVGTKGGLTLTAPVVKSVSSGGSLTVTDIKADLTSKTIFATIIGANGVGTVSNFALWNFSTITGTTAYAGPGNYVNDISGLSLTTDGFTKFSQALGLLSLGKAAMNGITDYGTIHSTLNTTLDLGTPAIPEPSTYALMGLGLVGVAFAARCKSA
ncbi:PEP-CTERM sorting domain-containing protein [Aquabacterium sp.]|uniref:PEP-CTERM sorting domain-containing protein n=1 Tax=Aquabacterium sp. TaxID=1872578 RepID=UPI004037BBDA